MSTAKIVATALLILFSCACFGDTSIGIYDMSDGAPSGTLKLLHEAVRLAESTKSCGKVWSAVWTSKEDLVNEGYPASSKQFFVSCVGTTGPLGGYNLFYTKAQLEHHIVVHRPIPVTDSVAKKDCVRWTQEKLGLRNPYYDLTVVQVGLGGTLNNEVVITFTGRNQQNKPIFVKSRCIVSPSQSPDAEILLQMPIP